MQPEGVWSRCESRHQGRLQLNYLSQRTLMFKGQIRGLSNGILQGSVLGPLLWNVALRRIQRLRLTTGCKSICYADTMVLVKAAWPMDLE